MNELALSHDRIESMSNAAIDKVRKLTESSLNLPQMELETHHLIHAGMYARTIVIPEGAVITGVLIKIPTILIVSGHVVIYKGDDVLEISGYQILPASKNRKQAFFALKDTHLTMIFSTNAESVGQAEAEFTDETEQLLSHNNKNQIIITGE